MNTHSHAFTYVRLVVAQYLLANDLLLKIQKRACKNSYTSMMELQPSKHLVAKSQFPFEPNELIGKAEPCPTHFMIHFMNVLDGSADKTASLEQVCLHSRSDRPQ